MTKRRKHLIALFAALAVFAAACSSDSDSTGAPPAQEDESPPEDASGTTDDGEQSRILLDAYANDPGLVGLDPIAPPDYANNIVVRDTSQYLVEGDVTVAFAIQAPEFSWPATYNDAVTSRQAAEYPDIELLISGTGLGETDTQVGTIEDLLVREPDVLIITPLSDVRGPIERAAADGVPVVLCTGTANTDQIVTRVDRDNRLNGAIGAEWIARSIGYEGNVVLLSGIASVPTAEDRLVAATAVFDSYEGITVLGQEYTNWDAAEGKVAMQSLLTRFDDIDAVWADGAGQAIGAVEAYKDAGLDIPPFAAEPLNGFLRLASEEGFDFVAVGYPPSHSASCLDTAMAIVRGQSVPSFVNVDVPVFETESLDDWYRPNCIDDLWLPSPLSDEELVAQDFCDS